MSIKRNQNDIINRLLIQIEKEKLDAIILTTGDAIFYTTGYASSNLYRSGQVGATVAVVTKEGKTGLVVSEFERHSAELVIEDVELVSYPTWIYIEDYAIEGMEKDVQPDLNKTYKIASQFIKRSTKELKIGVQSASLPHTAWKYFSETFGEKNLVDIKPLLAEARTIKTPWEIDLLRRAAHYTEIVMNTVSRQVVAGMTEADVINLFNLTGYSQSSDVVNVSNAHTIAANFTPSYIPPKTRINRGDIIRLDGGVNISGYNSDLARTFAVGNSTYKEREELYAHLWSGYEYAINNIGPGVKLSDIFNGIHSLLKERGFNNYIRGHQGHSIGCSLFSEEYPFIGPDEHRVFEPGMVFNVEVPYYSSKNQTYNIEDTFLVTETGIELFTKASPSLYL
ncbi:M24 family metallopeptidase [Clostridium beijerinckii]|uniref:M24 family metallopeptidase n=1 Tax=Clostridium beijerinckii TaxID=1520 RepID=UPI00156F8E94|nr:M24 family metallopeptidase [Clostridium beijerinckii]NRT71426.1 Xaa-Pro aminopeptidase [Clostridium beijerinckii]